MSAYYYLGQPFTYGDKKYLVTAEACMPTIRIAWYDVIVQIQDHFGWTHWCDFREGKGVTASWLERLQYHAKCRQFQIQEVGIAEKPTQEFTEEKRRAFAKKAKSILNGWRGDAN